MNLEKSDDYREQTHIYEEQLDIPAGPYYLLSSVSGKFATENDISGYSEVWISDLAIVMRQDYQSGVLSGMVMNADNGEPVAGANVNCWYRDNRKNKTIQLPMVQTDANGLFKVSGMKQHQHTLIVDYQGQSLAASGTYYLGGRRNVRQPYTQTQFFTDRSIYRPGQTIYFKSVSYSVDQQGNNYQALANQKLTVQLMDRNGEEVSTVQLVTNEYGSASGQFTAPRGSVTGYMNLRVASGPRGTRNITVEEYKRPKFYVEIESPEKESQLDKPVEVQGKATGYTGAPIDGAAVSWTVSRGVQLPEWWYWRCWWWPPSNNDSQIIARGTATTEVDGSFKINFDALPDRTVPRESEPTFRYTIAADVTDTTGETRSNSTSINVGYSSLAAKLAIADWQVASEPVDIKLTTETLDGVAQESKGTLKVISLTQPDSVHRESLQRIYWYSYSPGQEEPPADLSDFKTWPEGDLVTEREVDVDGSGKASESFDLKAGAYKAIYETQDAFGNIIKAEFPFMVIDEASETFAVRIPDFFQAPSWSVEPGNEFKAVWGTGYDRGRAYVEVEHRHKILQAFWTDANTTQTTIRQPVSEQMRGGFTVRVTYVRENRAYTHSRKVVVPWSNKQLKIKWERFVSKLTPGGEETFTAVVSGPKAENATAELVAALYDASLDAFLQHNWQSSFNVFYQDYSHINLQFQNSRTYLTQIGWGWGMDMRDGTPVYRYFDYNTVPNTYLGRSDWGRGLGGGGGGMGGGGFTEGEAAMSMDMADGGVAAPAAAAAPTGGAMESRRSRVQQNGEAAPQQKVDLETVTARKNLQETAFFFPHLNSQDDGSVRIQFTIPEALTKWKFLGFAHDAQLRTALLTDELVTTKDLMVQPNPPRFLREGDALEFSVKVSNRSATRQTGKVRLSFADAMNDQSMDSQLQNSDNEREFEIPAGQSTSLYWKIMVPDFTGVLTYKAVGATDKVSDGEEGFLPVLSRRILVTESLPLPINGNQKKEFTFDRLTKAGESDSLQTQSLTVQMTSNPSWYAVMALPYLMEYPHECSEQTFNRFYANALAKHIADSSPRIRRIFDQWKNTGALNSPLQKNEDLLNVMIEETPWLRNAKSETQARQDVGILFDDNQMTEMSRRAMQKLVQAQNDDGSWPWFPGGRGNDYITLYIVTGFARLDHLGVEVDMAAAEKALASLDRWFERQYQAAIRDPKYRDTNHLDPAICLYLYARSFYSENPIADEYRPAMDYFLGQAKRYWLENNSRQSQGHLAIALKRLGDLETARKIMASLKERSVTDEEMGMLWRDASRSWWWYQAPIETQALMIEAFDEVVDDADSVEQCKIWLLKQKQTQSWSTTKSTADAVYALLMRGSQLLDSTALVEVALGGSTIEPDDVEAGTGFYEKRFVRSEVKPEMGSIVVNKTDDGIAWGSVHWQYLEDIGKIDAYEGTPLKVNKSVYRKINTDKGKELVKLDGAASVGDELVMRIELRVDRDMEFVHLKDYRGSGTEPVDVLSKHQFQNGMYYYQSTRDTASHFFIEYLPRGTYVFEYSVRVQHRGTYESGIASIQCMYAPEFNSHSESVRLTVD